MFDDIYDLLCVSINTISNMPVACNAVMYTKAHKHHKCYKCRQYGHIAKHCGRICTACGIQHNFGICIRKLIEDLEKTIDGTNKIVNKLNRENGKDCLNTLKGLIRQEHKETKKMFNNALKAEKAMKMTFNKVKQLEKNLKIDIDKSINKTKSILSNAVEQVNDTHKKNNKNIYVDKVEIKRRVEQIYNMEVYDIDKAVKMMEEQVKEINYTAKMIHKKIPYYYDAQLYGQPEMITLYRKYNIKMNENSYDLENENFNKLMMINNIIREYRKTKYNDTKDDNNRSKINRIVENAFNAINGNILNFNTECKYVRYERNSMMKQKKIIEKESRKNKKANTIAKPIEPKIDANGYDGDAAIEDEKQEEYHEEQQEVLNPVYVIKVMQDNLYKDERQERERRKEELRQQIDEIQKQMGQLYSNLKDENVKMVYQIKYEIMQRLIEEFKAYC